MSQKWEYFSVFDSKGSTGKNKNKRSRAKGLRRKSGGICVSFNSLCTEAIVCAASSRSNLTSDLIKIMEENFLESSNRNQKEVK